MTIIRAADLETTGFDPSDEVVELGYYDIYDGILDVESAVSQLVKPARPIPASASATHHIVDQDVEKSPAWNVAWRRLVETRDDGEELKFAAHNARFERQWLDPLMKVDWICTWKCALRQWPDLEGHSLQIIRYALPLPADPEHATAAHRARADAYLCALLVIELLKHQTVETLVQWSSEPAIFTKLDFGEHTGKPLAEVRSGYFEWMLTRDFSEDWKWNAQRELDRRANAAIMQKAAERREYVEHCMTAIAGAATERDLVNWYHGSSDHFARHGILVDSPEYVALVEACKVRKAYLKDHGEPDFGGDA